MWLLYELLYLIGFVLYLPSALWRRRLPHAGWTMRLGWYPAALRERLAGRRSIWVHAVSVGEALAAQPLLQRLRQAYPDNPLAISTITPGGFDVASKRLGARDAVLYLPLDLQGCVDRALDALSPRILILMESELWPMLIRRAYARGIPVVVVNGRMSPRAFRRAQWFKPWLGGMLGRVATFLMQSREDAGRLLAVGASPGRVHVAGSLKWDASLGSRPDPGAIAALSRRLGLQDNEQIIVGGSTHRGEEAVLLQAFQSLATSGRRRRLILAPRYLERLSEVEGVATTRGLQLVRLSEAKPESAWDVGLVDAFGQLPLYYGLASVVFIGGSLIPHGGQNPLEATSLGKPVVFGPSMHNFAVIAHELLAHHAARQVGTADELVMLLEELLSHGTESAQMGRRAQELTEQFQGASERTLAALQPLLAGPAWPAGYG